jgi:hypothetical protein
MNNLVCESCQQVFSNYHGSASNYAKHLIDNLPCESKCNCETLRTTEFSPAPISGAEVIVSGTCLPQHWDEKAQSLTHMAAENAFTQGLSVTRMDVTKDDIKAVMAKCKRWTLKPKKGETPLGVALFTAAAARTVLHEGKRAYFVFDTAGEHNKAHGDVVATKYFGDFARLSPNDRLSRTVMQMLLTREMKHVRHPV